MLTKAAQEIAKSTSDIINSDVIITDENGIILGSAHEPERIGTLHEASIRVIKLNKEESHDDKAVKMFSNVRPGITLPIEFSGKIVGSVGIAGNPKEVSTYGRLVKKQVEILLREEVFFKSALLRECTLQNLIQEILEFDSQYTDENLLFSRGQELGRDLKPPHLAVVVELFYFNELAQKLIGPNNDVKPELEIELLKLAVLSTIKRIFNGTQDIVTSMGNDKFVILHHLNYTFDSVKVMASVKEKCSQIITILEAQDIPVTIGIGPIAKNLEEMAQSYRDAWQALNIGKKLYNKSSIYLIQDFLIEDLISAANIFTCNRFIQKTLKDLKKQNDWEELSRTIHAWCESGFSPISASKKLYIHRNTLFYRLEKISQISGFNLRNFRNALTIYLAILLDELLG